MQVLHGHDGVGAEAVSFHGVGHKMLARCSDGNVAAEAGDIAKRSQDH